MRVKIYPSMLSANPARLGEELAAIEKAGADGVHWDVMDGSFVDAITFGAHVVAALRPFSKLRFDAHLMVENPEKHLETFVGAGADSIILHPEATRHLHKILWRIKNDFGKMAGVALNPATSLECLEYCWDLLDVVVVMTVNPGSSGQKFIESQLKKIQLLRKIAPKTLEICVDGGVNAETAQKCIESGADSLVSGSFVFGSKDYEEAIKKLYTSQETYSLPFCSN